jgi:hypothetical protein
LSVSAKIPAESPPRVAAILVDEFDAGRGRRPLGKWGHVRLGSFCQTAPYSRGHHWQLHQAGNEEAWWQGLKIDAIAIAKGL